MARNLGIRTVIDLWAAVQSLWELIDSGPTARELSWTDLGHLHLGDSCIVWSMGPLEVGPRYVPDT